MAQSLTRRGCSLAAINRAVRTAFDDAFGRIAQKSTRTTPTDIAATLCRLREIHETITCAVSSAVVDVICGSLAGENLDRIGEPRNAAPKITVAPTEDRAPSMEITSPTASHVVLALAIPQHIDEQDPEHDRKLAGQRKLHRVQALLRERLEPTARIALSPRGGTIVLPAHTVTESSLDELVSRLSWAAQVPVTAITLRGSGAWVRRLSDLAHDLLNVAQGLGFAGGLYRFPDLALEYQLTRPTPAREKLAHALDPLDDHPELLHTLTLYIHTNMTRRITARLLNLHRNTIDYRLNRIEELTGYDPSIPSGIWYLRCALVVRTYRKSAGDAPAIGLEITA
ncbi:PucR family transcriptional regulator [Nocardia vinacea]|uniref:PucR family transcriptional regulator n=1 Tax=Nocardia vinacea TaxID=96468 RepID=UPI0012F63CCD|nr:helix-turn-helix domain-containing protein [Nocardia vinacea]